MTCTDHALAWLDDNPSPVMRAVLDEPRTSGRHRRRDYVHEEHGVSSTECWTQLGSAATLVGIHRTGGV
jgi:hypothetical protein